jgi:beta-N-acetylhexosaminidase
LQKRYPIMRMQFATLLVSALMFNPIAPMRPPKSANAPSSWAAGEVSEAKSRNLVPSELLSHYQSNIRRDEFAKLAVYAMAALKSQTPESMLGKDYEIFSDTKDPYVHCASALSIVHGRGGSIFDPSSSISRQEAAVMLRQTVIAFGENALPEKELSFSDSKSAAIWATDAIAYVDEKGIMVGVGGNRFDPSGYYTREQAIATFLRLAKSLESASGYAAKKRALRVMDEMTLEEKVGQLFMCDPGMLCGVWETTGISSALKSEISKRQPGGFIFFSAQLQNAEQAKAFISDLQSAAKLPLFISVDEEGGTVSRLGSNPAMNFKKQPSMSEIGKANNPAKAYAVGQELAQGLRRLGFNMDFAPVADVNTNPKNPVIGNRSFGSDPNLVANMVAQEASGLQDNGALAVLKHFPGHGDSSTDSHTGEVSLHHSIERLESIEFVPFKAGIEAGAAAVMVSHIALPKVTGDSLPATINPKITDSLLRTGLGYGGLVVTDSLSMGAISKYYELSDVCVRSILAGCDLLLLQTDSSKDSVKQFDGAYDAVLNAAKSGKLPVARLDQSVERILQAKLSAGLAL